MHLQLHSTSLLQFRWGCAVVLILFKLAESFQSTSMYVYSERFKHCLSVTVWLAWLGTMHCDRLLFVSGHKSNSFHNTDDFFLFATFIQYYTHIILYAIMLHTLFFSLYVYPLTQIPGMLYYFILSVQIILPSRLQCKHKSLSLSLSCSPFYGECMCVYATYHLSDGNANTILVWEFYRLLRKRDSQLNLRS